MTSCELQQRPWKESEGQMMMLTYASMHPLEAGHVVLEQISGEAVH